MEAPVEFLPQRTEDERPAVRVGDALVFVYMQDGTLRITVDTEDTDSPVDIRINVNYDTIWEGAA